MARIEDWQTQRRLQALALHDKGGRQKPIAETLYLSKGAVNPWLNRAGRGQSEGKIRRPDPGHAGETAGKRAQGSGEARRPDKAQSATLTAPWMRYFLTYDPRPTLQKVSCPVLALNGEKDLQVPPKQNLPELEKALKAGGNKNATLKELPGLNHLFQTTKSDSPSEYGAIEGIFSPAALQTMGDWILSVIK